jgi:hypothetical protein
MDVLGLRETNERLRMDNEMKRYQIESLENRLRYINQQYDIVRQEALRAEQLITGVQHHLREFPNDTSRAVKHLLSAR